MIPGELKTLSALLRKLHDSDEVTAEGHEAITMVIDDVIPAVAMSLRSEVYEEDYRLRMGDVI